MGKTPSVIQLQPNRGYVVQIEKDGHKPRSIFLGNKVAPGWLAIDILCGVLPLFVDAATGSWYTFTQRDFNVRLEEEVARSEAAEIGQRSEYTSETVHIEREKVAICYGGRVRILYKKLNDGDATISFSGIEGLSSVENGSVGFQVNDLSIGKEDIFYIFLDSKKRLTCTVLDLSRKELTLLISPQ